LRSRRGFLLVASGGGHLAELHELCAARAERPRWWVTHDSVQARELLADEAAVFVHGPSNRSLVSLLRNLVAAWALLWSARPAAVITTGAGVAVPFCYLGRLIGAKVIYVESFARVDELSLTGRLVLPVAHDCFVQWPELAARHRRARYAGSIW
jgi:beta-1,4-N-acetylglucosaminyltransferase